MTGGPRSATDVRGGGVPTPHGYRFELTGGALCLDFANTLDERPTMSPRELLPDYRHLVDWSRQAGALTASACRRLLTEAAAEPPQARAVVRRARALREIIFEVFAARAREVPVPQEALHRLNLELRASFAHIGVARVGARFCWDWDGGPAPDRMLWPVARSAAELLTSEQLDRVRVCAAADCDWLFLDRSKNRSRRWCDMRVCGNRSKVRQYRAAARGALRGIRPRR